MKNVLFLTFAALFFSCATNTTSQDQPETVEIQRLDSLVNDLDETQKSIEMTKKELEEALNDLNL